MNELQRRLRWMNLRNFGGVGYNDTTQAFIDRVALEGGTLTANEKSVINNYTNSIQIEEFDRLWLHWLSDPIAEKVSVANAATADLLTYVNSPTHTPNEGVQGNGTTQYIDTNYNPSVDGVKYTLNSASFGSYDTVMSTISGYNGCYTGSNSAINSKFNSGLFDFRINDITASSNQSNSTGLVSIVRVNSSTKKSYVNSVASINVSVGVTGLPNTNFYLFARSESGTAEVFNNSKIAMSFIGSGAIDQAAFYTATQTMATEIGFNV